MGVLKFYMKTKSPVKLKEKVTKVSENYQTSVPKIVRDALLIRDGNQISWNVTEEGDVIVERKRSAEEIINDTAGIGKDLYKKYGGGKKWLEKERESWDL